MENASALIHISVPIQSVTIGLAAATFLAIIHRFYVRTRVTRTISGVDWIMLLTFLLFVALCGLSLTAARAQLLSIYANTNFTSQIAVFLKIAAILYKLATSCVKLSIGGWMPKTIAWVKPLTNGTMLLMVIFTCISIGMTLFPCGAHLLDNLDATCNATAISKGVDVAWSTLNTTVGIWLLAVGAYEIYTDMCSTAFTKTVAFALVFFLGVPSIAAAGSRVTLLLGASRFPTTATASTSEVKLLLCLAAVVEVGLAILLGCSLVVRAHFARWLGDGSLSDPLLMAAHGHAANPVYMESRPTTAAQLKEEKKKAQEVFEWKEALEKRKKRNGLYVSARELEEGMSPELKQGEKSIWV